MSQKKIGVSILSSDILDIAGELEKIQDAGIKNIHLDVMDTSFTENISFGPSVINKILEHNFVFDIHMMLKNPLPILRQITLDRVEMVVIHAEIISPESVLQECRGLGVDVGIAINPETPLEAIEKWCPEFVLVMCVNPGFGGQAFMPECVHKVRALKQKGVTVGVDGGVNSKTIALVKDADYFVVGSAFFRTRDKKTLVQDLYRTIGQVGVQKNN